jgi:hypothetical protein
VKLRVLPLTEQNVQRFLLIATFTCVVCGRSSAQQTPFDGSPWNISTGNLSVTYIQHSPIGAYPQADYHEPPPSVESLKKFKDLGLTWDEDYIAWGAVEREPNKWDWSQHDAMEKALHAAGLKYTIYNWAHFPPVWLRERPADRTLMRCLEHGQECHYLSIFDPRTLEWYDHFNKANHDHYGDHVDEIYACILGPYGEGNYPLMVPDWVNMGHCHEGYWCGDEFAIKAFRRAMQTKYRDIGKLNAAWHTALKSFDEVAPPRELSAPNFKPSPDAFPAAGDKRRWLDFITWYHQAIIDFTEKSIRTVLKCYPLEKIRTKPGGNAGSVNPIAWGTYCPGYAKMAAKFSRPDGRGIVLQPADCQGAIFGDKWMATAYHYYGVRYCSEPASGLGEKAFAQRLFSDASCGAAEHFTYEFQQHAAALQKYVHLYTGLPGETEVAVYCPTTLYRLGVNLYPTIVSSIQLRDLADFDVLDELLIADGALTTDRYKSIVIFQSDIIDQPILNKLAAFAAAGGKIYKVGERPIKNVEGEVWTKNSLVLLSGEGLGTGGDVPKTFPKWLTELAPHLASVKGAGNQLDHLWTTRRGNQFIAFNPSDNAVKATVTDQPIEVAPHSLWVAP